jgi:hypothetical protein
LSGDFVVKQTVAYVLYVFHSNVFTRASPVVFILSQLIQSTVLICFHLHLDSPNRLLPSDLQSIIMTQFVIKYHACYSVQLIHLDLSPYYFLWTQPIITQFFQLPATYSNSNMHVPCSDEIQRRLEDRSRLNRRREYHITKVMLPPMVCRSSPTWGPRPFLLLSQSCGFVALGRPLLGPVV